ncbi:ABC transporter ATP-binding protein [Nocardia callitridis]|uniref:ABC transporter ATP-binding protein n=1 Tax=Nocardia callitridis TaxID=648753 RepID=A0ABP9KQL5_9NOCA
MTTTETLPDTTSTGMRLALRGVRIAYGGGAPVILGLDLEIDPGEILVLVGKSGCGKSTVLRALAGLRRPQGGHILADDAPVSGPSADRALIFQDDALLPWRTVERNIELALRLRGVPKAQRRSAVRHWIGQVGLDEYRDYLPRDLSGGMRQRVQLARGLAASPRAVLMDEPFGALDSQTRETMQRLLIETWRSHPTTVVFVTHDLDEALLLGDRVAVLADGELRAVVAVPDPRQVVDRRSVKARILEKL